MQLPVVVSAVVCVACCVLVVDCRLGAAGCVLCVVVVCGCVWLCVVCSVLRA